MVDDAEVRAAFDPDVLDDEDEELGHTEMLINHALTQLKNVEAILWSTAKELDGPPQMQRLQMLADVQSSRLLIGKLAGVYDDTEH